LGGKLCGAKFFETFEGGWDSVVSTSRITIEKKKNGKIYYTNQYSTDFSFHIQLKSKNKMYIVQNFKTFVFSEAFSKNIFATDCQGSHHSVFST
jgi:thiamine pyrophosphokinase